DELRCNLVQTVAMVGLLLTGWVEPPRDPGLNLSTLLQQILSTIAQHGGATATQLHRTLCGPGPFAQVDAGRFARLLRAAAATDLISQAGDGTLLHGQAGERIVNHYSFYTAFQTPAEWRLVADGRTLGTLPIAQPLLEDSFLIFAGRRWRITSIDPEARIVELSRATGGVPPNFGGSAALIDDRVRSEMLQVYRDDDIPAWLDVRAATLLGEGRAAWQRLNLGNTVLVAAGTSTIVFPWSGDRSLLTASCLLRAAGVVAEVEGPSLMVAGTTPAQIADAARALLSRPAPDPVVLARQLSNTELDKWDWVLDNDLAAEAAAARLLDVDGARRVLHAAATSADPAGH
ncbi:MAG: hypothetical protein ACRDPW_07435, partial [Mycobacteriales bacterium]